MILKLLFVLGLICSIHEVGHYIYAKYKNCNPKIRIRWFGLELMGFFEHLTFSEGIYLRFYGIISGYVPVVFIFYNNHLDYVTLIYLGFSILDLLGIVELTRMIVTFGNRKLVDRFSLVGD